jgi:streptogramin lyase
MENEPTKVKIKPKYFIISCILMILITSMLIFVPKENWKKIFSGKFFNLATVFRSNDFESGYSGNWNDPNTWGISYTAPFPYNLDISSTTGEIYVADEGRIFVLNPDGTASTTYPVKYNGNDTSIDGIVLNQNKIYVSTNRGVIMVLNPDGSTYATYDGGAYAPITTYSISISPTGYIYTADWDHSRIVVLNPNGTASTTYPLSFNSSAVAVSNSGNIYVSDNNGAKIDLLNPDGTASTTYDGGTFAPIYPQNITISDSGYIYLSDANRIVVLNPNGTASTTYDGGIYAPMTPQGIKISKAGELYVTDPTHKRIVVLNSNGTASTTYDVSAIAPPTVGTDFPGANDDVSIIDDNVTLTQNENVHNLNIDNYSFAGMTPGSLNLNGYALNVFGSFTNDGTLLENGGKVNVINYTNLTVNYPVTLNDDLYVNNLTLASGGILDLNGHTVYVNGDWNNTGGTLINNGGSINMIGTSIQKILGENTFENLKKIANTPTSLLFDSTKTTTITGNLILNGTFASGPLTIGSDSVAYSFAGKIGTPPTSNYSGSSIARSVSGEIFIADGGNNRITILNSDGTASTTYNGDTFAPITPSRIAVSQTTNEIYFIEGSDQNHVHVLNPDGTASTTYTFDPGADSYISGLAVSDSGKVYIEDSGNGRITVLNSDGSTATSTQLGFSGSNSITLSQSGEVYISSPATCCLPNHTWINHVKVLDPYGTVLTTLDINLDNHIDSSAGIEVSSIGKIYVGDSNGSRVVILNSDGSLDSSVFIPGSLADFNIDSSGNIYSLTNISGNSFVLKFNPDGSKSENFINGTAGILSNPVGITHDSSGFIYVSDSVLKAVKKYDASGNFVKSFDTSGPGALNDPGHLTVDSSNNIYVADQGHIVSGLQTDGKIIKFNSDGNYLDSVNLDKILPDTANEPIGVAVGTDGYIYIASENGNSGNLAKVIKLNPDLSLNISTTTAYGGNYYFYPSDAVIDPSGSYLYITEDSNPDVVKLKTSDLSFVSLSQGPIKFPFTTPEGMAFDSSGNVYVSDYQGYIIKLDSNFNFITSFGKAVVGDGRDGELGTPQQIMVDSNDDIYVADNRTGNIQEFAPASFSPFRILHTNPTLKNIILSYLSVSGSNNISSSPFVCATDCINSGFNSNWMFTSIPSSGGKRDSSQASQPPVTYTTNPLPKIVTSISISPLNPIISTEPTILFTSKTLDQYGKSFATTTYWNSSNTSIGTINSDGLFTAKSAGTTTITSEAGALSTSTIVTIIPVLSSISISPLNPDVVYKITAQFVSAPVDQFNNSFATTTRWKSSNTKIGTINSNGLFTAKNKKGTTIITASVGTLSTSTIVTTARKFTVAGLAMEDISEVATETPSIVPGGVNVTSTTTIEATPTSTSSVVANSIGSTTSTSTSTQTASNIVKNVTDSIIQTYKSSIITPADIQKVKEAVQSPVGSAVTKTISTVGIVAGAGASISAVALANPITFAELWLLPAKLFGLLLGALGIRRKNRPWGTVYDSVTKRPLDPVYVSLINTETNKEVAGAITDIDGRYGFLVLPGKYRIEARKTNYIQPSVKMKGKSFDEVYNDLYFGEDILITEEGQIITKNIPMDSLSFDWNEFAKTKMNVNRFMRSKDIAWAKISKFLFVIGALISFIAVIFAPAPYNLIIAGFYLLAYILNFIVFKTKKSGTLTEKNTNTPLSFAIVSIFREGETSPLVKKIADKFGTYFVLVPNGKYFIKIDKKENDGSYVESIKTESLEIRNGIININFVI